MKVNIHVKDSSGSDWWEEYELEENQDAEKWAVETVQRFNNTLRDKERPREVIEVKTEAAAMKEHSWTKTSLVSKVRGGRMYDTYQCKRCPVTAKRVGVGIHKIDSKWKARVYRQCDTTLAHLESTLTTTEEQSDE